MKEDLQNWASANRPGETFIYKRGFWNQVTFIRDTIHGLLCSSDKEWEDNKVKVISSHTSKSVELPVYQIQLWNELVVTMRGNFHNWKVSISSPKDITFDPMDLFNVDDKNYSVYFEGFPENLIYEPYSKNKRNFSLELGNDYRLFTFLWLLKNAIKE